MIQFYKFNNKETIKEIKEIYAGLSQKYKFKPLINVYNLFSIERFEEKLNRKFNSFNAGICSKNRIYVLDKKLILKKTVWNEKELNKIYIHEMVHAFNYYLNPQRSPFWLEEGIASYFSEMYNNRMVQIALFKNKLIDFQSLVTKSDWDNYKGILNYYQSGSFVSHLINNYSLKEVFKLKKMSTPRIKDFNKTFKDIFETTFLRETNKWKDQVKNSKYETLKEKWLLNQIKNEL